MTSFLKLKNGSHNFQFFMPQPIDHRTRKRSHHASPMPSPHIDARTLQRKPRFS
jgi:hypothetical protein